ncbi:acyltransferase-like protein [Sinobacterium caligoides]|uniref:Acyltransferase-like protein n=1 Tax=Sinobacterium caligoides TaxID=933926 RepID=A0A3N2DEX2_9GAMM|nr:acyltransferase family protein [Sinobacterium caligoides]ROR97974.1 acyltransferase-like protein [Sinobacterium caligoides]
MQIENTHTVNGANPVDIDNLQRRYDIDWIRTLAVGLLIIYHITVSFLPWAKQFNFMQNDQPLMELWTFMSLINLWRIPIIFMVAGMGLYFSMQRRNYRQLMQERSRFILLPLVFGSLFIVPLLPFMLSNFYQQAFSYRPAMGHLWFLGNIYAYVLLLLPLFIYLNNRPDNLLFRAFNKLLQHPAGLYLLALPMMLEAWLINPELFFIYYKNLHGFWLGIICFSLGFLFVSLKGTFWSAVQRSRHCSLTLALLCFFNRLIIFQFEAVPNPLLAFESLCWMLAIFGYACRHLNRTSSTLSYFSQAVFPVYIIHMPVQYAVSYYLLPLSLNPWLKLMVLITATFIICLSCYEYIIRRTGWLRPLFGMKHLNITSNSRS